MVSGGMSIVKYLIFVFNFIFVVSGIALISVGAVVQSKGREYTAFLGSKFVTLPNIVIVVGVVILIISFLGCCGAVKENYCMVMTFSVLVFLIFIIELGGGIAAYVYKGEFETFVKGNMKDSIEQYMKENKTDIRSLWDETQMKLKCCGVMDWTDYKGMVVPTSCCNVTIAKTCDTSVAKDLYETGCFHALEELMKHNIVMVAGAAVGVGVIELLGVIFACCLANAIKKEYEGV